MCGDDVLMTLDVKETTRAAIESIYHGRHFTVPIAIWLTVRPAIVAQLEAWETAGKTFVASLGRVALAKHDRAYAARGGRTDGPVVPCSGPAIIGAV